MADEGAADCEEGFVDVGASVIATLEATVLVQPGDRALDHPAFFAEPRPVGGIAFGDSGRDAPCAERLAVLAAVICPVGEQRLWPELAVNAGWRDPIHERDELGYVVAVTGGESRSQRGSLTVADHVVLGARPAAIDGRGACLFAPLLLARASCPRPPLTSPTLPRLAVRLGAPGASAPKPPLRSSPVSAASTSSPTHSPSLAADPPTECPS